MVRSTPALPDEIQQPLDAARAFGKRSEWKEALAKNEEALRVAEAARSVLGRAVAHRYIGLSHYRIGGFGGLKSSVEHLRAARALAVSVDEVVLAFKIDNHLGATLREQGHHDEAEAVFRDALRDSGRAQFTEVRARLMGNLGALLEELGQHEQAADCYARYEELVVVQGDGERIANARGLVGRSALRRKEFTEAEWRFEDEGRLAQDLGLAARVAEAKLHRGRLAFARWRDAVPGSERTLHATEAERWFREALPVDDQVRAAHLKMAVRVGLAYGEFLVESDRLTEAHRALIQARDGAAELRHGVLRAKAERLLSDACRKAGLHGEALWHLERAVGERARIVGGLKEGRVRQMAQGWIVELREQTQALEDEALRVPRSEMEKRRLGNLRTQLSELLGTTLTFEARALSVNPWEWIGSLRKEGEERWKCLLGAEGYAQLDQDSQLDLSRAEVAYHGAVDDLGRSAHLLAITVERELRLRMEKPLREYARGHRNELKKLPDGKQLTGTRPLSLGSMIGMLDALETPDARAIAERVFTPVVREVFKRVRGVGTELATVDGRNVKLPGLRNAVAHGHEGAGAVERLDVDAIKRALVLNSPVLRDLAGLPRIA